MSARAQAETPKAEEEADDGEQKTEEEEEDDIEISQMDYQRLPVVS